MQDDVVVMVLAGGAGERLYPLTKERAKPAVYFGGPYRIIDFTLSNCINSGLRKIFIAMQYKSLSLGRHIRMGWSVVADELGEFIEILSPQKRVGEHWYLGTADAVFQNLYSIVREDPRHLLVLSGDHVYKMDYARMLAFHRERGAAATIGVIEIPSEEASRFGVLQVDEQDRLVGFLEKPKDLAPGGQVLASMGIYIFDMKHLVPVLEADARRSTNHDFGKDIIPELVSKATVYAYRFTDENKKESKYWRDIGTLDAYYDANMDLCRVNPGFQPVRSGMAAAHASGAGAAGEVRLRRRGAAVRSGARLDHLGRVHHLGQPDLGQRPLPERARAQLLHRRTEHPDAWGARSAGTRGFAAPSSTATSSSRAAR